MTELKFLSHNGREMITGYHFAPSTEVTHVVQMIHGMAEHMMRYSDFAQFLNENGVAVLGHDHMAHGNSCFSTLGGFKDRKQADSMVVDAHRMTKQIKKLYPNAKITVFCHGMGSLVGRIMAARYPNSIDGLIICGTSAQNPLAPIGKLLALVMKATRGGDFRSKLIDTMSFGSFNKRFKNVKTPCDWLSSDQKEVAKYMDDPLCGFLFSVNGSCALCDLVMTSNQQKTFFATRNTLPIFIISGEKDATSHFGAGAKTVYRNYQEADSKDIQIKLYHGVRHEILLDQSRELVMDDVLKFVKAT